MVTGPELVTLSAGSAVGMLVGWRYQGGEFSEPVIPVSQPEINPPAMARTSGGVKGMSNA